MLLVALAGSALLAARRAPGWEWMVGSVLACATMLGIAGLLFPEDPSSLGTTGGAVALALADAFLAAAGRTAR